MKAVVYRKYGGPEVLKFEDVAKPTPKGDEVLVKIKAVSVNPLDWHIMRGEPFLARLEAGIFRPREKFRILGADIAGIVEAVGSNAVGFKPGDEVFGFTYTGGFAEYISVSKEKLVHKPANLSFKEAAAAPVAAITALQGHRCAGEILPGQRVLVNGSSGGVGTFAVQIAKSYGAEVTAVCSTRNLELVRSIGADHVIDYTKDDFTNNGKSYDIILDIVGNRSVSDFKRALTPTGRCVVIGYTSVGMMFHHMFIGPLVSKKEGKRVGMMKDADWGGKATMLSIKELLDSGKVKPVIDREYRFSELPQAIAYLEEGRARGKVVVRVDE